MKLIANKVNYVLALVLRYFEIFGSVVSFDTVSIDPDVESFDRLRQVSFA